MNTARSLTRGLLVSSILAALAVAAPAEEEGEVKLRVTPSAITIAKATPEAGQRGGFFSSGPASGVTISAQASLDGSRELLLVASESKLTVFRDDRGTNLRKEKNGTPGSSRGFRSPFSAPEVLTVGVAGEGKYQLQVHSGKVPARGAKVVEFAGTLTFAPKGAREEVKHAALAMIPDEVVKVGAAKLKFSERAAFRGKKMWFVQILPGPEMTRTTLLLFGKDEDLPILNTGQNSNVVTSTVGRKGKGKNPFAGVTARGFQCPKGELNRIVLRYVPRGKLIEVPFEAEVALGSFADDDGED